MIVVIFCIILIVANAITLYCIETFQGYCAHDDYKQQMLDRHNLYRKIHAVGDLVWDANLASTAKQWAMEMCRTHSFEHSTFDYGENIGQNKYAAAQVDQWYNEVRGYNFDIDNPDIHGFGHFTQLVWKGTKRLGCAVITTNCQLANSIGSQIHETAAHVCEYDPPGNSEFAAGQNVFKGTL